MEHFVKGLALAQELRAAAKDAAEELFPVGDAPGDKAELDEVVGYLRKRLAQLEAKIYLDGVLLDTAAKSLEAAPEPPPCSLPHA